MIVIEPLTAAADHIDAVVAIELASAVTPWTRRQFEDELANPHAWWALARERQADGSVVGFVGLHQVIDEGHIVNIAVDPPWRRRLVATRLLCEAFEEAWVRRLLAMTLEVRSSAISAQRLYHRFGFVPTGIRPRYYPASAEAPAEDGVIMWTERLDQPTQQVRLARVRASLEALA